MVPFDVVTGVLNVISNSRRVIINYHCKVKETLFIQDLQSALNANVSSEKLLLY